MNSFWAPGIVWRPGRRDRSGFRPKSLARRQARRLPRRIGTAAVPARARGLQRVARPVQPGLRAPGCRQRQRAPLASFPCPAKTRRSGSKAQGTRPSPRRPRCPGAPQEPCAWWLLPAGAECRASSRRQGSPDCSAERGSSLPAGKQAPGFAVQGRGPGLRSPPGPRPARTSTCLLG